MNDDFPSLTKAGGVFLIEVDKIKPNPMQPRKEFDQKKLQDLSESIRQYGVLQPLVVIRKEYEVDSGTAVDYELIAGERRLEASKLAGLKQVPVIIRQEPPEQVKLELALIENIQREDLSSIERAKAFRQLVDNFKLKHHEIGSKIGKSREFVSNTLRILMLPEDIQDGLSKGLISEGHTRPLLMLSEQPEQQTLLYKEIIYRQMNVREAERISRRIAVERSRKRDPAIDYETRLVADKLSDALGTRVSIERKGDKGKISIEFFSNEELNSLISKIKSIYENQERVNPIDEATTDGQNNQGNIVLVSNEIGNDVQNTQAKEDITENFTI